MSRVTWQCNSQIILAYLTSCRLGMVWQRYKIRVLGGFWTWGYTRLHLRWANWVGNVCRLDPRDMAVRRPIYLGLLGRRRPLKKMTVVKKTCSGWFFGRGWSRDNTWSGLERSLMFVSCPTWRGTAKAILRWLDKPATAFKEGDRAKIAVFRVVFRRAGSGDYNYGKPMEWEMFVGMSYVTWPYVPWPIYLGLLGRWPPSKRVTVLKKGVFWVFLDVSGHSTTFEVG